MQGGKGRIGRWLTTSYLRFATVCTLLVSTGSACRAAWRGMPLRFVVAWGVLCAAGFGLLFTYLRLWGRWRDRLPWSPLPPER